MNLTITASINLNGGTVDGSVTLTGEAANLADVSLAGGATNIEIDEAFKITDLTAGGLVLCSSVTQVTVKTNSSSVPDDTFTVPAGGFIRVMSLAADVTKLYATNGDPSVATVLKIRGVKDVTP